MARQQSRGVCQLCGKTYTKGGMSNHLKACVTRFDDEARQSLAATQLLHLIIQDRYISDYWLHLEVPCTATLGMLDRYLRDIWLECCGHLSEFEFNDTRYISYEEDDDMSFGVFAMPPSESMYETSFLNVLPVGSSFRYSYDFGSTTELEGRVVAERVGRPKANTVVRLLARNLPPEIPCSECGGQAARICPYCMWEGRGFYCESCASDHDCDWGGPEDLMPVVNSPRTGVCAYTGGPLT